MRESARLLISASHPSQENSPPLRATRNQSRRFLSLPLAKTATMQAALSTSSFSGTTLQTRARR